jgi:hypothetical protein
MDNLVYELRQIDAWAEGEYNWSWNESWHIAEITIPGNVKNLEKSLLYHMRKHGIVSKPGKTKLVNIDGSLYELQNRKTDEPLFAFVPVNH